MLFLDPSLPPSVQSGNTQLALQIIKRNQLLPATLQTASPDTRKKPAQMFQSSQPVQPIQTPPASSSSTSSSSSFTQVQRK